MAGASGLADYPFVIIPHPIAGNSDEALRDKAAAVYDAVVRQLTSRAVGSGGSGGAGGSGASG